MAEKSTAPQLPIADAPPQFYCAEIWGGNGSIDSPIELPGAEGWVFSRASEGGRGGDIHYVSLCNSGLISRICVADVVGHGSTIATVSTSIHGLLREYMNSYDQRRVLSDLNRRLESMGLSAMTTAAAVTYFPPSRFLSVSYAGHPPAWYYSAKTQTWSQLDPFSGERPKTPMNLPLAVDPDMQFGRRRYRVRTGDRLLVLSDGVLEAPAPGGDLFGTERLAAVLDANKAKSCRDLTHAVVAALCDYTTCPETSHDDVTLMTLEFRPGPRAMGLFHALQRRLFPRPFWRRGRR